jgi:chromosome partitioning protein
VAKSTTATTLAAILSSKGYKVLAVDMDPQCSATDILMSETKGVATLYDVFVEGEDVSETIQKTTVCDVLPCDPLLKDADKSLTDVGREYKLKEALASIIDKYDFIIIDTPPNVGILLINSLTAADTIVVPTSIDRLSLNGLSQFFDLVFAAQKYTNKNLKVSGLLATRHSSRTILSRQLMSEQMPRISKMLGTEIYKTTIRDSVVIKESQTMRKPLTEYAPNAPVTQDYLQFTEEFLKKEMN